jgi:hypothetical protein
MAVLASLGMVIVLRGGLGVVHITLGKLVHLKELASMSRNLGNRVGAHFGERRNASRTSSPARAMLAGRARESPPKST